MSTDERTTLAIDPHVHSEGSYDGHEPVELILEHAAEIDLDGVVVTDHDAIEESLRAAEIAPDYGLVGIPGVEVSTAQGHLLAVGVESVPERGRPMRETVAAVRDLGGAAVVPHPFQRSRHGIRKRALADCDPAPHAVEVYNSMLFTGYRNRRANAFAEGHGFPKVGSSDAHYLPNVGRAYTEVDVEGRNRNPAHVSAAEVVAAIREGETSIRGRRTPITRSARQYGSGALRKGAHAVTSRAPYVPAWPSPESSGGT